MTYTRGSGSEVGADAVFEHWLARFDAALSSGDIPRIGMLFAADCFWKDMLAFTWGYRTFEGVSEIEAAFKETIEAAAPRGLRVSPTRTPPRLVKRSRMAVIEAFFDFDLEVGHGTGFARLLFDAHAPLDSKAWIVLTTLQELRGFEEHVGAGRPSGMEYARRFTGDNWLDQREAARAFADRDPEVLVVGGGQGGLVLAARLGQFGVDTLVVEALPRVGDNWRNRYHSLTLHNEIWANEMPYMQFPTTWPTFLPKDKLAGWLEVYAEAQELNVWTGTKFAGADYDEAAGTWTSQLQRADGTERTVTSKHLVLATGGVSGVPRIPSLPGLEDFRGTVRHASEFKSGHDYRGKNAIVVGTGNSGHDVAQDLWSNGAASVTMVQRSPTCVVSLVPSGTLVFSLYAEGLPVDDVDLITAAIPYSVLKETYEWLTKRTGELDKDLLDGLHAAGFATTDGEDNTGFHMLYLRYGGGYYLNVGCSELIAERKIRLVNTRQIDRYTSEGLQLLDGELMPSDLVVLATGFENQQEGVRRLLGDEIADRVGPIWGFDENYIMRNMWQPTRQPGLWIMGGSLIDCRLYSRYLALQIKADIEGLLPRDLVEGTCSASSIG